jgi:Spy/CpxP family protein refolding chaperone
MTRKHTGQRRFALRSTAAVVAATFAMAFGGAALAQPMGGPHGQGGPGGPGEAFFAHAIVQAKAKLNLNTSQQAQFDAAVAQSKTAREQGRALMQTVKDAMRAELAKAEPDYAAVAAIADNAQAQGQTLRGGIRQQWLTLYATFSPEQKAVVRDLLKTRMDRAEAFRDTMQQRMQQRLNGGAPPA